jgi:hypothetical protein
MKIIKQCCLAVLLAVTGMNVFAGPEVIFHAPFDKDFSAKVNGQTVTGQHTQKVLFETLALMLLRPGVAGNAALIGCSENDLANYSISYPSDILNTKQGAISFWVAPQDWKADDNKFHVFFEAGGENAFLVIYKYFEWSNLFFLYGAKSGAGKGALPWTMAKKDIKKWKMKEWHFITCCWTEQKIWLYVDGSIVDSPSVANPPTTPFQSFIIGGSPNGWKGVKKGAMDKTLIDDVKIFKTPLSGQEVAALYGSYNFKKLDADNSPLTITKVFPRTDREKKILKLSFLLSRFQPDFKAYKVQFKLLDSSKKSVLEKTLISNGTEYEDSINVATLPPGRYLARITPVAAKNEKVPVYEFDYAIPTSPAAWDNNQCGVSNKVPPPWNDMKLLGNNTVECWGRQYTFGNNLFPVQISTGKYSLLQSPVRLMINGKTFDVPCNIKVVKESPAAIELECSGKSEQLTVKTCITVEYDGFMWIKLEVAPVTPLVINSMTLDVPLKKDCATLFDLKEKMYGGYEPGFQGAVTDKTISRNIYEFSPVIWLGNEDAGLQWIAENLKGWHNSDHKQSLQVVSSDNARVLRLNLVDSKVELAQPRNIAFGLQATPVKPLLKGWRNLRNGKNIELWFPWETLHNVPDAEFKTAECEPTMRANEAAGKKLFNYLATYSMSPFFPEFPWWCDLWSKTPPLIGTFTSGSDRAWVEGRVCPNAKSFEDFYAWKFKKLQTDIKLKNIYIDNESAQPCNNAIHGCGWTDDAGKAYDTWNILGTRRLAKRIYTMTKEYDPQGLVVRHMSGEKVGANDAFADILVDGELYVFQVAKDDSYFKIFTPAMFRSVFLSRQFGIVDLFIPQFERSFQTHDTAKYKLFKAGQLPDQEKILRHFKGYFFVHDAKMWPHFGVRIDDFWKIEDNFKMNDDTPFFGYWDKNNPFKLENQSSDREMVSAYVDQGKFMLIAMNDTDIAKRMDIKIDSDALAKSGITNISKLTNPETKAEIEIKGNTLALELKPRDYQIWIYKQ